MTYKRALILFLFIQVLYFSPVLFKGEVIFPHSNDIETFGTEISNGEYVGNRKFTDNSYCYIPEIDQQLHGDHRAWISTWNPYTQLGRPTQHLSGFSKAYLITHLLSVFIKNPFVFYTVLAMLTVILTGLFFFLFLKALDLHPLACLSASLGLSLGIYVSYWLTFVMFISTLCWTLCLLWLITTFINNKRSFAVMAGISFATYSLLMTGYPQTIILEMYLIAGFLITRLLRSDVCAKDKAYNGLMLLVPILSGFAMASPALLDLIINAKRSARLSAGEGFFIAVLPRISSFKDLSTFLTSIFDAFWLGNPIRPDYPMSFNALSFTPLYFCLLLLSFTYGQWRRLWGWQSFAFICLMATIWPPLYLFMFKYMGFHLSRSQLLGGAIIPGFILGAHSIDHILKGGVKKGSHQYLILLGPLLIMGLSGYLMWTDRWYGFDVKYIVLDVFIVVGVIWFAIKRRAEVLMAMVILSVALYGYNVMLVQPINEINTASPLVNKVKYITKGVYRYAKAGQGMETILASNEESLLGIRSIHSYDSLSSRNYQRLALKFSRVGTMDMGRHFNTIDADLKLDDKSFSYLGINCILSKNKNLKSGFLKKVDYYNGIQIYGTKVSPVLIAQVDNFRHRNGKQGVIVDRPLDKFTKLEPEQKNYDDFMSFKIRPKPQPTILFLSQQYHPQWVAHTKGDTRLKTVIINDFYQGVVLPPHATEVSLEFNPYVLWSWIPQVTYIVVAISLLSIKLWQLRQNKVSIVYGLDLSIKN